MKFNRTLYLGYYLKQLDQNRFKTFLSYAEKKTGRSRRDLVTDVIKSVYKHNISILEYFQFRFFEKNDEERSRWAGTGYMYEYQLVMNPRSERHILDDKTLFFQNYQPFLVHDVADFQSLKNVDVANRLLSNSSGKIVFKASAGKCGAQVEICNTKDFTPESVVKYMDRKNYGLAEQFIEQHKDLNRMSPSGVNTIRMITQINQQGQAELLASRFRISVNSSVDNMAAGNIAAAVDKTTGTVTGKGVYGDITKDDCEFHPATGIKIPGFQIPYWSQIVEVALKAAEMHKQNRSIGWDVVVTDEGPGIIEGNHDWCKLLWQLPVKKGLKPDLDYYLRESNQTGSKKYVVNNA